MAHALSLLRLVLAPCFSLLLLRLDRASALAAAALLCVAIATDLLDGPIARRRGTSSALGGALDHGADFLFVTLGLAAVAWRGDIPWLLPLLIVVAFAQYVLDSLWIERRDELRMSALGRYNGISYFVPLAGDILSRLGLLFLTGPVRWIAWLLVGTTLLSIGDRLLALLPRSRRAPGSHDAER
jgi:phosphatidylglycerophosphate synthase